MMSPEGESVALDNKISIIMDNEYRNIEEWLADVEMQMKKTMKKVASASLLDFQNVPYLQ